MNTYMYTSTYELVVLLLMRCRRISRDRKNDICKKCHRMKNNGHDHKMPKTPLSIIG